ncbi:glutathione S-transferase family protein [Inhella gelatinilytica]|uniref:Glutathione S-transferase n=1 Tax=Inhella gelatinilytica TaxID=2795030 RepID=A0A931IT55_9BURK|nr:glutathione S-transferase [Inhella gelatinilytica]MBH9552262.1 glutathione S-transferase [Inhella gelatinilytica]
MKLVIANKNYSSWSMRPWVLLKHYGIAFEEEVILFDHFQPGSQFSAQAGQISPTARVPVLVEDDGFTTWDSLAIAERVADLHPEHAVWPRESKARARARSLAATMHSGFGDLRRLCPMNIDCDLRAVGQRLLATEPGLRADLARLEALWTPELQAHGGPYLMGSAFGAVDAYFAPVAMRLTRYGLPLSGACAAYVQTLETTPAVQAWVADALAEKRFVPDDEPYRASADEPAR